ncbi:MAG: beta (1-6) glucans synthase [Thermodesulfobacteriota bacterium]
MTETQRSAVTLPGILAILAAIVLSVCFWYLAGQPRPLAEPDIPAGRKLQSVSYAPFRGNQSPAELEHGLVITKQQLDEDMAILAQRFECIRTYSVTGLEELPAAAARHGLKIMLGAWVSRDEKATQKELAKVIEMAKKQPDAIRAVVVGNEALLRKEVTGEQLAGYIRQVKAALPEVPVTYADVWEFWLKHPEVGPATDFVTIHILPYWEDEPTSIDKAMAHVKKIRQEVAELIPGRDILIGETGWPSEGRMREDALPSLAAQARFIRGFVAMAEQEGWRYNLIEAFDQPWKRVNEGAMGGHWGLYDQYRHDKGVLAGPIAPQPNWRWLLLVSTGLALLALPVVGRARQGMTAGRWLGLTALTAVGAILLALQAQQFAIVSRNIWEWGWAFLVLTMASGVWGLSLHAVSTATPLRHAPLINALRLPLAGQGWDTAMLNSRLRLGLVACAMVAVLGLVFDARYRNFNNAAFLIPALTYLWLSRREEAATADLRLEHLCGLVLGLGALSIAINETLLNWQADIWVTICLLLAWPLWREGRASSLRPLLPYAGLAALSWLAFLGVRYGVLESVALVGRCAGGNGGLICTLRSGLGLAIHLQIFGWLSVALAALAIRQRHASLFAAAIVTAMGSLTLYHAGMGSIAMTAIALTLAARRPVNP